MQKHENKLEDDYAKWRLIGATSQANSSRIKTNELRTDEEKERRKSQKNCFVIN
jgi:hypothetical protein